MEGSTKASADQIEQELAERLDQEIFEPPAEFREHALIQDESVYEEAARDPEAWWAKQSEELLDWAQPWDTVLDESDAPFYKWFVGGKLNASHQALDRHVEAGRGDRVAFHWRGEEGEERDVTYAELLRDVKRLANVLKDRGIQPGDVVGIYLPMIPEVAVAMLACARIGAPHNVVFGGFSPDSVKERMEFSDAKALITVDQARRKGKAADIKPAVDRFLGDVPSIETVIVVRNTGSDVPMDDERDVFYDEAIEAASDDCPAEPFDAEHPLFVLYTSGSTAKPKGILHTTGGYLTGSGLDAQARVRPEARRGRVLVLRRRRLGHGPLLHRLRAADERRHLCDVRGRSGLPGQGHLVGAVRALRRDHLLHGAHGHPGVHEVGGGVPAAP